MVDAEGELVAHWKGVAVNSGIDGVCESASAVESGERLGTGRSPTAHFPRLLFVGLFAFAALVAGWAWMAGESRPAAPTDADALPVIAGVPEFSLLAPDGRTVTRADLFGSPWVVDFIFTHCTGPCPTLTLRMRSLQESLREVRSDARLLSISLDPAEDTPAVMAEYARRANADPTRWWFLTGTEERQVHEMVRNGFLQTVQRAAPGLGIVHSAYFLVVDAKSRIRAAYDGTDPESKPKILAALGVLDREGTAP